MPNRSEAIERAASHFMDCYHEGHPFQYHDAVDALRATLALPAGPDLAAENERLRSIIEGASDKSPAGYDWSVLGKIDELERENERLRTALAFYVDPDNHVLVNYDRGDIARAALEGTK